MTTMYNGAAGIRERDAYHAEYETAKQRDGPILAPMQEFTFARSNGDQAVFRPDGSFDALRQQGKLSDPNTIPGEEARNVMREKKYFMPGYTGFVRGHQHISGRTYGEMTRRAFDTEFEEHLRTSPIPSAPQSNRKITHKELPDTFVTNNLSHRHTQIPGYTGHVPGVRATYAKTFGETTLQQMKNFGATTTIPRSSPIERRNFAYTTKPRSLMPIDSAPLPGTHYSNTPPRKMIPSHLKFVQFFPM